MPDMMTFPETVDEYMEQYKITDAKQIYTNGAELVPIFRMKQWFEHKPERKTGKWVKVHGFCTPGGDPVWACSECGKGVHVYGIEHGTYGADVSDGQWKACPNCGAMMDGEEDD